MKKFLIGLGVAVALVGCTAEPAPEPAAPATASSAEHDAKLEKAKTNCERVGGTLQTITRDDGTQFRICGAN